VTPDEREVLEANERFYRAFEALDVEAMVAVWSEEAPLSCVHPGWEPLHGREAVLSSWRDILQSTHRIRIELRNAVAHVAGGYAWVVLVEDLVDQRPEGELRAQALATNVFVREAGSWRMVHHHASARPTPRRSTSEPPPLLH
jgi:ketosteroid isomerase-like protein